MLFYANLIIITFLLSVVIIKLIYNMLMNSNALRKNYRGEDIPVGMGMIFPIILICSTAILYLFFELGEVPYVFVFGVVSMAFLGVIDDIIGNRDTTGFKGHITKLFKMKLTTGGLKAVMGGVVAVMVSIPNYENFIYILFNALIIALFSNFMNLLDLRPGRSLKTYILYTIFIISVFFRESSIFLLIIVTISAIIYFPYDIKARSMLGDVGSNTLGFVLGYYTTLYFSNSYKIIMLLILILIHYYAEKKSITKLIEKNSILHFIDKLGR